MERHQKEKVDGFIEPVILNRVNTSYWISKVLSWTLIWFALHGWSREILGGPQSDCHWLQQCGQAPARSGLHSKPSSGPPQFSTKIVPTLASLNTQGSLYREGAWRMWWSATTIVGSSLANCEYSCSASCSRQNRRHMVHETCVAGSQPPSYCLPNT